MTVNAAFRQALVVLGVGCSGWSLAAAHGFLAGEAFDAFSHAAEARCPGQAWRQVTPGDLDAVQESFIESLRPATRRTLAATNQAQTRCTGPGGLSCPTTETLAAFDRLHLMRSFAAYACAHPPPR